MSDRLMYGLEDQEVLTETDPEDVVGFILDSEFRHIREPADEMLDRIDFPIRVFESRPKAVAERDVQRVADSVLDEAIEIINEEYGNPEEIYEVSEHMKDISVKFAKDLVSQYHVWQLELTGKVFEYDKEMICSVTEKGLNDK